MAKVWIRLRTAALLALITSFWCWVLTAMHGIWSFGIVLGYLDGGRYPLYSTISVTYGSFFIDALQSLFVPFILVLVACTIAPRQFHLIAIILGWLIGAIMGAFHIAFLFQIDFGTTWLPHEAFRALFYHPLVSPVWIVLGVVGAVSLTRTVRNMP